MRAWPLTTLRVASALRFKGLVLLTAGLTVGCAGKFGRGSAEGPEWVRRQGPCFLSGRITVDGASRASTAADDLSKVECNNLFVTLKTDEDHTQQVQAEGVFASSYGQCRYQFSNVPEGQASVTGRVVAVGIRESWYVLSSESDFNAIRCGGTTRSLNQTLDMTLKLSDVGTSR